MIQIQPANDTIIKLLGTQNYSRDDNYRLSFSCIQVSVDDQLLIYNCVTKELILISQSLKENDKMLLINKWFLVPENFCENKMYKELRSILTLIPEKEKSGTITILPTTACNANCFYCFEKNISKTTMTSETALQVCRFIERSILPSHKISLHWFGGEPLLSANLIEYICSTLRSDGWQSISSSLVTNGYLLNEELLDRAVTNWGLQTVQITLDGTKEIYTRTKAFSQPIDDAYTVVLNNIKNISDSDIALVIRLNIDKHNVADMFSLIEELSDLIVKKSLVSIRISPLFDVAGAFPINRSASDRISLYDSAKQLLEYAISKGFNQSAHVSRAFKRFCCTADNDSSIIILPTGDLIRCENIVNLPSVGSIFDPNSSISSGRWHNYVPQTPLCDGCPLSFNCLRPVGCKELSVCYQETKDWEIEQIKQCMMIEYSRYISRNPNESL